MSNITTPFELTDGFNMTNFNAKLQEVNTNTIAPKIDISTATANLYGLSGSDANVDKALTYVLSGNASYMAFCANANADSLDAAFGKNNESDNHGIGKQLAMYAWFKGANKATSPFASLISCDTLQSAILNQNARNEMAEDDNIVALLFSSPYAKQCLASFLPNLVLFDVENGIDIMNNVVVSNANGVTIDYSHAMQFKISVTSQVTGVNVSITFDGGALAKLYSKLQLVGIGKRTDGGSGRIRMEVPISDWYIVSANSTPYDIDTTYAATTLPMKSGEFTFNVFTTAGSYLDIKKLIFTN